MKFKLGQVVMTKGVSEKLKDREFSIFLDDSLFNKYMNGDWGDTCEEDSQLNNEAIKTNDERILAVYKHPTQPTIWIITEWDHSVTTILFPDEY